MPSLSGCELLKSAAKSELESNRKSAKEIARRGFIFIMLFFHVGYSVVIRRSRVRDIAGCAAAFNKAPGREYNC